MRLNEPRRIAGCCHCIWGPNEKDTQNDVCMGQCITRMEKLQAREWSLKVMYGIVPNAVGRRRRSLQRWLRAAARPVVFHRYFRPVFVQNTEQSWPRLRKVSLPTPHVFNFASMRPLESAADSPRVSTEEFFNRTGRAFDSELLVIR